MKFKDRIIGILFPPKCIFCRRIMTEESVCDECLKKLPRRKNPHIKDGAPFVHELYSPLYYEGYVRSAVLRYKFGGIKGSAREFAKILLPCIEENLAGKYDCITWVPTSKKRIRKRGYDQAELLAREIGKLTGIPVERFLKKSRDARAQSKLTTREQRVANVIGAFQVNGENIMGARILLVDDISTTGSTVSECARVLRTAGADKVYAVALAKKRL